MTVISTRAGRAVGIVQFSGVLDGRGCFLGGIGLRFCMVVVLV